MRTIITALLFICFSFQITAQETTGVNWEKDVVYGRKYGMSLTMDVYYPKESNQKAIVFINSSEFRSPYFKSSDDNLIGSDWLVKNVDPSFPSVDLGLNFSLKQFIDKGFVVFDVSHSSSPYFNLHEIVNDLNVCVAHLRENTLKYKIKKDEIHLLGMNEAAYVALYIANRSKNENYANSCVAMFPKGHDFVEEFKKFPFLKPVLPILNIKDSELEKYSLKNIFNEEQSRSLIIIGKQDNPFVNEPSVAIYNTLKGKSVETRLLQYNTGNLFRAYDGKFSDEEWQKAVVEIIQWFEK